MTQFKTYRTRPVTVDAVEITDINDIYVVGGTKIRVWADNKAWFFTTHKEPETGDFIIKQSEDDIYLCPREVFLEKYMSEEEDLDNIIEGGCACG